MRSLIIGMLVPAHLLISACSERGNAQTPVGPKLTVEAQEVVRFGKDHPQGKHWMHGKFTIRGAKPGERLVWPATTGGACLIARFKGVDRACSTDAECDHRVGSGISRRMWVGYCLPKVAYRRDDIFQGQQGKCWVKPSENYCLKGVGEGQHYLPDVDTTEVYDEARKYSSDPVDWMVLACLNGGFIEGQIPACGLERIMDESTVTTVP